MNFQKSVARQVIGAVLILLSPNPRDGGRGWERPPVSLRGPSYRQTQDTDRN